MEELLIKLADILDMSVDGVLKTYPALRSQFVNSYLWKQASSVVGGFTVLVSIVFLWLLIEFFMFEGDRGTIKNLAINLVVLFILMITGVLIANKTVQLAPDLLFLESLNYL